MWRRGVAVSAAFVLAAFALELLGVSDRAAARSRPAVAFDAGAHPRREPAPRANGATTEAVLECRSEVAPEPSALGALASLAAKTHGVALAAARGEELERELLGTPASADKVALRVRLERLLRERPELAPAAARAFSRLEDRETLFVVSRALVGARDQADVRAALLDAAGSGPAARREVALLALPADAESLLLARRAFDDGAAAPTVRAAGAYALARGWEAPGALDDDARSLAVRSARSVASSAATESHLRAEALHLLARNAARSDGGLAEAVLAEPGASAELALAAAHLALATGAEPGSVAAALARNPERACALAAATLGRTP